MTGFFLTFEGGEGSGKSTQVSRLAEFLREDGWTVRVTREPGGSPAAEALRDILLAGDIRALGEEMETLLFAAARADHIQAVIAPALAAGEVVLCDRFHDSTRIYQAPFRQAQPAFFDLIERSALAGTTPDLTILLDLPADEGLQRAAARRGAAVADRFEGEGLETHETRRFEFLRLAREEPERCRIVDAGRPVDLVARDIRDIVGNLLTVRSVKAARYTTVAPSA